MAEKRIIARAQAAGTRRLSVVPLGGDDDQGGRVAVTATPSPPATGLNAFLAVAQRQGAALIETAKEQAERIAGEARSRGYEEGYAEGRAQAEREIGDLLSFAESAVREVADTRTRLLEESETALVELALDVAAKVLQAKLEIDPARVVDVLRGALRKAYVRDKLTVICNPQDLALIEGSTDDLRAAVGTLGRIDLVGDRRVARGGVIVRTDAGDVDATLDAQLARLRETLLQADDV